MAFLALFFRESANKSVYTPNSGVYSIETSEVRQNVTCFFRAECATVGFTALRCPDRLS
jgi:hypothetical protein